MNRLTHIKCRKNRLHLCLLAAFLLTLPQTSWSAELVQRDWMVTLIDALGWSYGLPDEPQVPDYLNILSGNRRFRFEAEDIYARGTDNVSLMTFRNFGNFSGRGWLHGTNRPTELHLSFNLPIGGTYRMTARLRQQDHLFQVGEQTGSAGAEAVFSTREIGTFTLPAGPQEIVVTLPPNGSIDYITLTAPNLASIAPAGGWLPDEPLTWPVIETTLLQLLDLAELFPPAKPSIRLEAEEFDQDGMQRVDIAHLGQPSAGEWLRAGAHPVTVRFPLMLPEGGFYDLSLRVMGTPVEVTIGDHRQISLQGAPFLSDTTLSTLYFQPGPGSIRLAIPAGGGVDRLDLTRRQVSGTGTATLLGIDPDNDPAAADLDHFATLLAAFGAER